MVILDENSRVVVSGTADDAAAIPLKYLDSGLCVLPAVLAEKRPALPSWKDYQKRLPFERELRYWFRKRRPLCILTGEVSGHLEMIDFDYRAELFEPWQKLVAAEAPGLVERLVIERSQSDGRHACYRCRPVPGNRKLAQRNIIVASEEPVVICGKEHVPRRVSDRFEISLTLIETRGEGGLFLCDPTPGYVLEQGSFENIPTISENERTILIEAAGALNELVPDVETHSLGPADKGRPGDDYNERGDVREVLNRHGWQLVRTGDNEYWRRPGKKQGWSATFKGRVFFVFSTHAAPFESHRAYAPFNVYALLEHAGDYTAAAAALHAQGYGEPTDKTKHRGVQPRTWQSPAGDNDIESEISLEDAWPDPLSDEAYHGIAGKIVETIEPHSEADPAALLIQFLALMGNVIHRTTHFCAEADEHFCNLFACLVGRTSKGRKGSSLGQVRMAVQHVDPDWHQQCVVNGLSSGEGLIWAVRDKITKHQPIKGKGRVVGYEDVVVDPGVDDKRLLVVESEFASVLKVIVRDRNTLSAIMRQAWDTGNLRTITKNSPTQATGAHISIIGHITRDELRRLITETELANGLANRFLWICVRRSKCLPFGGTLDGGWPHEFVSDLQSVVAHAAATGGVTRDADANSAWDAVYPELSEGKPGMLGAVTSRAEAQVMRLATLYAVLDRSHYIRADHLMAALAVWQYAEQSARYVFGSALGDPTADEIARELRRRGSSGMTRQQIREHFGRHKSSDEISRALAVLVECNAARSDRKKDTGGRPAEVWFRV